MSNAQLVYSDLTAAGLSPGAATGVLGNLIYESGLDPRISGDHGTSHGIAQWHLTRWDRLVAWAKAGGRDPYDLRTQTGYLVLEAKQAGVWDQISGLSDPVQAAAVWMRKFERPKDQSDEAAVRRAQKGIDAVNGEGGPSLLSGAGAAAGAVGDAITGIGGKITGALDVPGAISGFGDKLKELTVESLFVVLGLGLVGAGVYVAVVRPSAEKAAGAVLGGA